MKKQECLDKLQNLQEEKYQLERQVDFLLCELIDLSQGLGVKPSWYCDTKHTWKDAMSHKAGIAIKRLHEMRK